ncbi:MAG: hypothetical protein NTU63_02795 [Candidatus Pacearchaeota archaeon]|nr:hypothetical protein [Candidatus Pacearchaeota archaeon]
MKKTLRSMIAIPIIAASLLLPSCGKRNDAYDKALNAYEKSLDAYQEALDLTRGLSSRSTGDATQSTETVEKENLPATSKPKVIQKSLVRGLENYFFQGNELELVRLYDSYDNKNIPTNPLVTSKKDLNGKDREELESNKISKIGLVRYYMPKIEEYSHAKELCLDVLEFESKKDKENFMKREDLSYPIFTKDNIACLISLSIEEVMDPDYLSPKQKMDYGKLIRNYAKRTNMEVILSEDATEQEALLEAIGIKGTIPGESW